MSADLATFLLARIAEDEAEVARWQAAMEADEVAAVGVPSWVVMAGGLKIPARVLAECEARRRIVETYEKNRDRIEVNASDHTKASARGDLSALPPLRSAGWDLGGRGWALEITLRLLALPFADHPDYDPSWRL